LATHPDQVKQLQQQLAQLSVVDKTISLFDLVPEQQSEKLALIEETSLILGSQLTDLPPLKPATDPQQAIEKLLVAVEKKLIQSDSISQQQLFTQLTQQLKQLLIELDYRLPQDRQKLIEQLQNSLLGGLPLALKPLAMGLNAEEIDLNSIPFTLKQRWLSNEGWYRIQIFPKQDLNNLANLSAFITQVQSVSDKTTDLPVMFLESMKAVVSAFQQAIITAILTIALLLWWLRRQFIDMLLVMIPLLLSGLFTMACTVLTHTPINFANIIALPLLLGLGVDNGIHMLEKLRHSIDENQNLYQSSTARGIFYGALTTISSFIGLAFSPHQGVASMGLIITIGIFWIMIGTFIILPALSRIILPFTTTSNTHS
jgi:predicted exporter